MPDTTTTTRNTKPVLGLLGAPGSGKSTVAGYFAELGCGVIDADKLAHAALQSGAVREQLREWWGEDVIDESGQVDRKAVGRVVFDNDAELKRLESVLHPRVHAGREAQRSAFAADPEVRAIIEDTPLLLESGLAESCDALIYIDCPYAVRLDRVADSRGWDAEVLQKREKQQTPLDIKRKAADYVISTDQAPAQVREQAKEVLSQFSR